MCDDIQECPYVHECSYGQIIKQDKPGMSTKYVENYCLGHYYNCARYIVKKAGEPVPSGLLPAQSERVSKILF